MKPGDRVRLVHTDDPHTRLEPGAEGVVIRVSDQLGAQVWDIRWNDGSALSLIPASGDRFEAVH